MSGGKVNPDGTEGGRRGLRSTDQPTILLREQMDNLSTLITHCDRARALRDEAATQPPGPTKIRRRMTSIEAAWTHCFNCHHDLRIHQQVTEVYAYLESTLYTDARDRYLDTLDILDDLQDRLPIPAPAAASVAPPAAPPSRLQVLDKIPLPIFDGDNKDWPHFYDMFMSLIVNDNSITNVHKFYYLKQSLRGNALTLIKNINVTNDTFVAAWELIRDHYQDVQVLTFSYLTRLLKLEPVHSTKGEQLENLVIQTREILTSLTALGEPVEQWGSILVVLTLLRLDQDIRKDWECFVGKRNKFPNYTELETFLKSRIHAEAVASIKTGVTTLYSKPMTSTSKREGTALDSRSNYNAHVSTAKIISCVICNASHDVKSCGELRKLSAPARLQKVRSKHLCFNCFHKGHLPNQCHSHSRCSVCKRRHHSLLHEALVAVGQSGGDIGGVVRTEATLAPATTSVSSNTAAQLHESTTSITAATSFKVLLATAEVNVCTPEGRTMTLRALVDQGSERSFLSETAANVLRVNRRKLNASVIGIGGQHSGHIKFSTVLIIKPVNNDHPGVKVECLLLNKLTSYMPRCSVEFPSWKHVSQLPLADPTPASLKAIDLIIGADVFGRVILNGLLQYPNEPVAQLTIFGWILSGSFNDISNVDNLKNPETLHALHVVSNAELQQSISKFWSLEDIPTDAHLTEDERKCEDLFRDTTFRDIEGRFHVQLPFKSELPLDLGCSREIALKQYARLERRLSHEPELSRDYHDFLREYLDLGHMIPYVPSSPSEQVCYIPHHPVIKATSTTTKLRVVFNASCQTSNGRSLNDNMLPGPVLQQDLSGIIMRWRLHRYVLSADIEKMFRQIRVINDHTSYQLILWRMDEQSSIQPFRLQTVTYGTVSAPFLSIRVLHQLAEEERQEYPLAYEILSGSTYVDDVVFGADTLEEAREARDQIRLVTTHGGFSLRKWSSNSSELLQDLPTEIREIKSSRELRVDDSLKVLGVSWFPSEDYFQYTLTKTPITLITKRSILSVIAKLYDPLGWITPVIVIAKIYMQQLWLASVDWDTILPSDLARQWTSFYDDLSHLSEIRIPRWVNTVSNASLQLHGFCDASQHAYAAAVYLRVDDGRETHTYLIVSKSKVAPLKTLTIPRLELCAAELLSRLLVWTTKHLHFKNIPTYAWSDSSVTLAWITGIPSQWKIFVANRVSRIQSRCEAVSWYYVPSEHNPADLASRGVSITQLKYNSLWWHGPHWLQLAESHWHKEKPHLHKESDLEERPVLVHIGSISFTDLALRVSDWGKLIRAAGTMLRYRDILRSRVQGRDVSHLLSPSSALILEYRNLGQIFWLKVAQGQCFADELPAISRGDPLPPSNRLSTLDPYLDQNGVIRVGGRLDQSTLSVAAQHPTILGKNYITTLIIRHAHHRTLHGGISLTMRYLFQTFWIFRAKIMIRSVIAKCVSCARNRAQLATQRMASLPSMRVQRHRPFQNVGVDYAGPIFVRISSGRGRHACKAYIAIFVCMATRCIHLELVTDYTSAAFLAAFTQQPALDPC